LPQGAVFSSANFLSAGTRAAIDQALFMLMKAGTTEDLESLFPDY